MSRMSISIIIPCYNTSSLLFGLLESITKQTLQPSQVIIVDDGSTQEGRHGDFEKLKKQYPSILVLSQAHENANVARNLGASHATGKYFFFCDSDLVLHHDFLKELLRALEENPQASFAYCNYRCISTFLEARTSPHISGSYSQERLHKENYIDTAALMRSKHFAGFDPLLKRFQDWDLWLTMARQGYTGVWVNKILYDHIERPAGISYQLHPYKKQFTHIIRAKHGLIVNEQGARFTLFLLVSDVIKTRQFLGRLGTCMPYSLDIFLVCDQILKSTIMLFIEELEASGAGHQIRGCHAAFVGASLDLHPLVDTLKQIHSKYVIFMQDKVKIPRGWLDSLLVPFIEDHLVGASFPRRLGEKDYHALKNMQPKSSFQLDPEILWIEKQNLEVAEHALVPYSYVNKLADSCVLCTKDLILEASHRMTYQPLTLQALGTYALQEGYRLALCRNVSVFDPKDVCQQEDIFEEVAYPFPYPLIDKEMKL